MANGTAFFKYVETIEVGSDTFYGFSVSFGHDDWMDVLFPITGLPDELVPLLVIDVPNEIPSIIYEDTEIDDSFTAPADLYYAFTRANTFHEAAEPTAPSEANVVIAQAFLESCIVYYVDRTPDSDMELPGDNDPADYEPDANGWYYPPYADFDFVEKPVANRHVSFQLAGLDWYYNWVYNGCEDMHEDYHIMNSLDEATFASNGFYSWSNAKWVNCCNAGVGSGYRIIEETISGVTSISVWLFSPETDVARHYAPALFTPVPVIKNSGIVPVAGLLSLLVIGFFGSSSKTPFGKLFSLSGPILHRPRGHSTLYADYPRGHSTLYEDYPRGDIQL